MSAKPAELSVVIPAYNEGARIRRSLEEITAFLRENFKRWEVLVVDDGSTDDTAAETDGIDGVRYLKNDANRGKGFTVRRGMLEAEGDAVLFTDADLSAPIPEARRLHSAIARGADVAIASRQFDVTTKVRRTPLRRLMAFVFRTLVKVIVIRGIYDTQCGFKMFRREAAQSVFPLQRLTGWGFDVELLYISRAQGWSIEEVAVSWTESDESRLSWRSPFTMIFDLLKIRANALLGRYRSPARRDEILSGAGGAPPNSRGGKS